MNLNVHLLILLFLGVLLLHDGFEEGAFGEFAAAGELGFFGMVAVWTCSSLFLEKVGFDHVADVLFAVDIRWRLLQQLSVHKLIYKRLVTVITYNTLEVTVSCIQKRVLKEEILKMYQN